MIFFSATDIGGARALVPVMAVLAQKAVPFCLMDAGALSSESSASFRRVAPSRLQAEDAFRDFIRLEGISVVCFGTAAKERLPIYHARWAASCGVATVAVLDNWMNYLARFELPDLDLAFPDRYFVMDEFARQEAVQEGVPTEILEVTGQPGLWDLALEAEQRRRTRPRKGAPAPLVFLSEPASTDQGSHPGVATYRGYTEFDVLGAVADFLATREPGRELLVAPHPREDRNALLTFCGDRFPSSVRWCPSPYARGREAVLQADGVIGMTSILLYEAWLLGIPVASLQPGVIGEGVSHLKAREGIICTTKAQETEPALDRWMAELDEAAGAVPVPRPDLALHRTAPGRIAGRLEEIAGT